MAIASTDANLPLPDPTLNYTLILHSIDFGASWERLPNADFSLTSIAWVPGAPKTFFAVSGFWEWFDLFEVQNKSWASAYTTDGGISWTIIDRDIPYNGVQFVSKEVGWVGTIGNFDYGFEAGNKPAVFKWNGNITDIDSPEVKPEVSVAPNPFTSHIQVVSSGQAIQKIEAFNAHGKPMFTLSGGETDMVDLSGLPVGLYVLRIQLDEGFVTRKVVKVAAGR